MVTAVVLAFVAYRWWVHHQLYLQTGDIQARMRRAAMSWAFIGACLGSSAGLVWGGVIAMSASVPAALFAYLLAILTFRVRRLKYSPDLLTTSLCAASGALVMSFGGLAAMGDATNAWWVGALAGGVAGALIFPRDSSVSVLLRGGRRRALAIGKWIGAAAVVAGAAILVYDVYRPHPPSFQPTTGQPPLGGNLVAAPSVSAARQSDLAKLQYHKAVAELEAQYPEMNPDLPQYNVQFTEAVAARSRRILSEGQLSPADSLRVAAAQEVRNWNLARQRVQAVQRYQPAPPDPDSAARQARAAETICRTWPEACRN